MYMEVYVFVCIIYVHIPILFSFKAMPFKTVHCNLGSSLVNTHRYQLLTSMRGLVEMSAESWVGFFEILQKPDRKVSE